MLLQNCQVLGVLVFLSVASCGRPRYIAIPVDDVRWLETAPADVQEAADPSDRPLYRIPRGSYNSPSTSKASYVDTAQSSSAYDDVPIQNDSESEEAARVERQSGEGHHQYVDYGAHTGHHGAFGWYADFPVRKHSR